MAGIGNLFVKVTGDEKSLEEATRKIKTEFKKAGDVAEKEMPEQVKRGTKKMEGSFASLGKYILGIFSVTAIFSFVKQLFRAGSDLEETTSKFNQVFKDQADANQRFETLAKTLGRSELQMKQFGATTGAILKPLGFATEDALDLSQAITQLSIDIASFNNVSDEQANNALNRALTGEREALKSLGIAINETDIKNEYMRLGFKLTGDELSKQGKALATLSLLYKQTADAQGDAVRTGDSWANQLKRFRGSVLDAFAQAGRQLSNDSANTLSTMNKYVVAYGGAFLTSIVKSTDLLISQIARVANDTANAFNIISGNTNKAKEEQLSFIGVLALTWLKIATGVAGIVRLLQFFGQIFGNVMAFIHTSTADVAQTIPLLFRSAFDAIIALFRSLGPVVSSAVGNAVFKATEKIIGFINNVKNAVPGLSSLIKDLGNPFKETSASLDTSGFKKYFGEIEQITARAKERNKLFLEPFKEFSDDIVNLSTQYEQESAKIQKDFNNSHIESAKTQKTIADQVQKQKEEEKKTLEELIEKYKNATSASAGLGKGSKEAGETAKQAMSQLKDEVKKLEDSVKDLEKAQKDENDAVRKYHKDRVDDLRKIGQELDANLKKYEETIALIKKEKDEKLSGTDADEQNTLAERYAEIQKEISDLQKNGDAESQAKINELLREKAIIQGTISQSVLDEAVRVANLTEAERIQLDFAKKRQEIEEEAKKKTLEADAELQKEKEKLEQKRKITEYYMNLDSITRAEINKLEADEDFKKLDAETQNEILRQAEERLRLEEQKNIRIGLEEQVNNEIQRLSNVSTQIQKTNLASLSGEYKKIIADLDSAIARQRTLNALRSSGPGFAEGGYTGDGGVNEVAGTVHKGEYVVPQSVLKRSPELLGALESMRKGQTITNHSKAMNFNGDIHMATALDFDAFLESQKFRL